MAAHCLRRAAPSAASPDLRFRPASPVAVLAAVLAFSALVAGPARAQFTDATIGVLADAGPGTSAAWDDFDGDGDIDLYLVNTNGWPNKLLTNVGGTFVDNSVAPLDDSGNGLAVSWGDDDQNGALDLLLLNGGESAGFSTTASARLPPRRLPDSPPCTGRA